MTSYAETNTTEIASVTADTETLVLDTTIPSGKGGRIRKIVVSFGVTAAAGVSGYVELKLGSHAGPFRFPVKGLAMVTSGVSEVYQEIDCDIEVFANETVKGYLTMDEAVVNAHVGIVWVA